MQTPKNLLLFMEYYPGNNLGSILFKKKKIPEN